MRSLTRLAATVVFLTSCTAAHVTVAPDASRVRTGTQPPAGSYEEVGAITATHGGGCGLYGAGGNYEGAYTILRNKAAQIRADYVQILRVTGPHMQGICAYRGFVIDGMAYRAGSVAPRASTAMTPTPQPAVIPPSSGLNGTFAGEVSGIQGDRSFTMGVSFTIVQTDDKIAGAWTTTSGTSGTVTGTVAGQTLTEIRVKQINPCGGEFGGIASIENGGLRLRGSYLGNGCGSPVNASFVVTRQQ
jgi:hypothetical protein